MIEKKQNGVKEKGYLNEYPFFIANKLNYGKDFLYLFNYYKKSKSPISMRKKRTMNSEILSNDIR